MNLKIIELELKSQPSTLLEVREQREAAIKDGVATVDTAMVDFTVLFEQAMEVVMTLQEDPTLQVLNTEVIELQQQYDEVRETTRTVAIAQCFAKLQEVKTLLTQVEATKRKEVFLKVDWGPSWMKPTSSPPIFRRN